VAPVSVLVDPIRALRSFGVEEGGSFSEKVLYIYMKQLEEADLVIISKCDLLDDARLASLRAAISARFPGKATLAVSPREGIGLEPWFAKIAQEEQAAGTAMAVDYAVYADGEALLGWLNWTAQLAATEAFDGNNYLRELAGEMQRRLQASNAEVAHLKMTLSPDSGQWDIAAVNLVRDDFVPELSMALTQPVRRGRLLINLRAEAAPDVLGSAVHDALAAAGRKFPTLWATTERLEQFRPGKPMPTHRIEGIAA
jgi:hypothetical protein